MLALDGQASGATPAYGDLLELGWAVCSVRGLAEPVKSQWIAPRSERRIHERCASSRVGRRSVWRSRCRKERRGPRSSRSSRGLTPSERGEIPTIIHFARFELRSCAISTSASVRAVSCPSTRCACTPSPSACSPICRGETCERCPATSVTRRSSCAARRVTWRRPRSSGARVVPLLEQRGVGTWSELKDWLGSTSRGPRSKKRSFPLAEERRRALPKKPGVYRFLRRNGDVLYVGKATSLKSRVAGHFKQSGPTTERSLELLTQVHDIAYTETESLLEAALLETDEIKRLDPPYNVQLKTEERRAWFATRDFRAAEPAPDATHLVGPLPSERAVQPLFALVALAAGVEASSRLAANALAVPDRVRARSELFEQGFRLFAAEHLDVPGATRRTESGARVAALVARAAAAAEVEPEEGERAPDEWDLARVQRRLERSLVQCGLLVRRARGARPARGRRGSVSRGELGAGEARHSRGWPRDRAQVPSRASLALGERPRRRCPAPWSGGAPSTRRRTIGCACCSRSFIA